MNKTLKYALSAVLGTAVVTPALAQDQFPDVPENHWAYEALQNLKTQGILVGYPDGRYRGPRNATRYELAVAVNAAYQNLRRITDGLAEQIRRLEERPAGGGLSAQEVQALRDELKRLQDEQARMKGWGDEIASLKRMASTFEKELASMGVDVAALQRGLSDIADRVSALERRRPAVDIHGDVNFVALGGYSRDDDFGITVDGRPTGTGGGSYAGTPVGATRDFTVLHEAALTLTGTNEEGPKWGGTLVFGNMLQSNDFDFDPFPFVSGKSGVAWGDQAAVYPGVPFSEANGDFYVQDLWIMFDTSMLGQGFNAQIGRVGYAISPYIFMRPDNTPYFSNERWDNGRWMIDGAILGFNFGAAKLNVFGGRTSGQTSSRGVEIQPMFAGQIGTPFSPGDDRPRGFSSGGQFMIDQMLGANLNIPITQNGQLNLAYLWLDSNTVSNLGGSPAQLANGVNVFGGDIRFNFGGPVLEAGYSQSNVRYNDNNVVDEDNAAWFARIGWKQDRWGINLGYRQIEPQFAAPGWWGRIGTWWNPTDIKGFMGDAHFDLNENIRLTGSAEFYTGTDTTINGVLGLTDDDEIRRYVIGLAYRLNNAWDFGLGYERVEWDLQDRIGFTGGKPTETWWTLGFGYTLSNNTALKLQWQISDADGRNIVGFNPSNFVNNTRARGGLVTAQLSVKF